MKQAARYGTWKSPISSSVLSEASATITSLLVDKERADIYYIESRPSESGRSALLKASDHREVLQKNWDVRTTVHEYGGVPAVAKGGIVYFSSNSDKRVYKSDGSSDPCPITPENQKWRYADLAVVQQNPTIILAIQEDHTRPEPANVVNKLVAINAESQTVTPFATGADFYAFPTVSPNNKKVAWVQWHLPDMPWEGSELVVADFAISGNVVKAENAKVVSGKTGEISVNQPRWVSDDVLLFLNDSSGYVNPWKYTLSTSTASPIFANGLSEDFSEPAWTLGGSDSAILHSDRVLYSSIRDGHTNLSIANVQNGLKKDIPSPYVVIKSLTSVSPNRAVFIGKKDDEARVLVEVAISDNDTVMYTVLKSMGSQNPALSPAIISKAQAMTLSVPPDNEPVHVLYYPPYNPEYSPEPGEHPPAVVQVHGGPTSRAEPGLDWAIQFWTTRGWAWVDVNYSGSSGYGRKERLKGQWGIADANDTINAVAQLSERGLVDPKRCAIRGRSAGGYTVLVTLTKAGQPFAAGASSFGIADLQKLGEFTHKFESGYLFGLLGVSADDKTAIEKVCKERSPLTHADKIEAPLLILQGSKDAVVPPEQAELIVKSLQRRNGRVKYILFDGEGHGWRKAENIQRACEEELAWYQEVFNLEKND